MANQEHLEILSQGANAWNEWREENSIQTPDFRNANLRNIELNSADLSNADLRGADLREVKLCSANLIKIKLSYAKLFNVDFSKAKLFNANCDEAYLKQIDFTETDLRNTVFCGSNFKGVFFSNSDLSGSDLSRSELTNVVISSTKLTNVNFRMSYLHQVLFFNCDTLNEAHNLEYIKHYGESSVDNLTLKSCVRGLPNVFLQGMGYSNEEIKYLGKIYSKENIHPPCFVKYSYKDKEFGSILIRGLQNENIPALFSIEDSDLVKKIRPEIREDIRLNGKQFIVLSKNSIDSDWVKTDYENILSKKENLYFIKIDDSFDHIDENKTEDFEKIKIIDFTNWDDHFEYEKSLDKLLKSLKSKGL